MRTAKRLQKFIIVSNRLPISVSKQDGKLLYTSSPGGLATAMSTGGVGNSEKLWIGWPGISSDELEPGDKAKITRRLRREGCYPVFLSSDQVKNYYEGYANDTIWPMFHYFQPLIQYKDEYWKSFKEVNKLFSRATLKHADSKTSIWVHDYQLMLLPQLLRDALPSGSIGFFLHIPFPSYEIFRLLPNRREILLGLMGADLIGFHIYDYARHFLSSVQRIMGNENANGTVFLPERTITVDAFPIGIDYKRWKAAATNPDTVHEIGVLDDHYQGRRIILSVDRLDYSKGILKRLEAFEQFLKRYPAYHKKIVLVVIAVPSRVEVETYKDLREAIERSVSRINGTYSAVDWTPISYQFKNLPFEQLVALYSCADVALVTPLRDGMNLVAKEYVASKKRKKGVLILSEMTGAIDELPEALPINPNDVDSIVKAIKMALVMPQHEQRRRLESMQKRLSQYTVQRWARDFIEQLSYSKWQQAARQAKEFPSSASDEILEKFSAAKQRLIILDYDGTLQELVSSPKPSRATPLKTLLKLLERLTTQPNTKVCIVSGRPRAVLDDWFGHLDISLAAEHGAWVKESSEWSQTQFSFQEYKKRLLPLLERYAERTPGAVIEEKGSALVWHYRNVSAELAFARNTSLRHELRQLLGGSEIGTYDGHKIIEIKPKVINKGSVALEFLATHPADFILTAGDDYTDEAMFQVLPEGAYTIKVGLGESYADYRVPNVNYVLRLLRKISNL